jgi:hypothetical protein
MSTSSTEQRSVFRRKPVEAFVTETAPDAEGIVSSETGAAGLGGLLWLLREESSGQQWEQQEEARRALNVNRESCILLFNCEGATDPDAYDRLVGGRTLPADKSRGSRYLSRWSSAATTQGFRLRALLTEGGDPRVQLHRA